MQQLRLITTVWLILPCIVSMAQTDSTQLIKDTITVVKTFTLESTLDKPVFLSGGEYSNSSELSSFEVLESIPEIPVDIKDHPVRPIRYTEPPVKKSNDGLISIGYGIPDALEAKLYYDYHIEDWYHVGAKVLYSSANDNAIQNMRYNRLNTDVYGGYWLKPNLKLHGGFIYHREDQGLYNPLTTVFNEIGSKRVSWSNKGNLGITWSAFDSKRFHFSSNNSIRKYHFSENTFASNYYSSNRILSKINNQLHFDVEFILAGSQGISTRYSHFWKANPHLLYNMDAISLSGGIDILNSESNRLFWPYLSVVWQVEDTPLQLGFKSEIDAELRTMQSLIEKNPFLDLNDYRPNITSEQQLILFSNYQYQKHLFSVAGGYARVDNQIEYDFLFWGLFDVEYSGTFNQFPIKVSAEGGLTNWLNYRANVNYTIYDNIGSNIGYLPQLHIDISLMQTSKNKKLKANQNLQYITRNSPALLSTTLSPIVDLSAQISYQLFNDFELYVKGSNLLFQDYEIWQQYAIFQPMVLGGFTYIID